MFETKPNEGQIQNRMFERELDFTQKQNALDQASSDKFGEEQYMIQQEKKDELVKWQQDIIEEIELTIHDIKREMTNNEGNWVKQLESTGRRTTEGKLIYNPMKPMMNDMGVNTLRSALRPLISRNLMMSNYDEERILTKLKSIVITFVSHLAYNYKDYEIDPGDLSIIIRMFKDLIEPAHFRALNDGERRHQREIIKRVEAHTFGNPVMQKPKGFLGSLFGGR